MAYKRPSSPSLACITHSTLPLLSMIKIMAKIFWILLLSAAASLLVLSSPISPPSPFNFTQPPRFSPPTSSSFPFCTPPPASPPASPPRSAASSFATTPPSCNLPPQPAPDGHVLEDLAAVLRRLGFMDLAGAARRLRDSPASSEALARSSSKALARSLSEALARSSSEALAFRTTWTAPITVFAVRRCGHCVHRPGHLRKLSVHGLLSIEDLSGKSLLETVVPCRYLTVETIDSFVYVRGLRISRPNLYKDGRIVIHELDLQARAGVADSRWRGGFSANHIPVCPASVPEEKVIESPVYSYLRSWTFDTMRYSLLEAVGKLSDRGYTELAKFLLINLSQLQKFECLTMFAVSDRTIFDGEVGYRRDMLGHMVAAMLPLDSLEILPVLYGISTMGDQRLIVTSSGGGPVRNSVRLNYVRISDPSFFCTSRLLIHAIPVPFPSLQFFNFTLN